MFKVNGREIGEGQKPYIIAELSANHAGSIQRAKDTMLAAKRAGADAIKNSVIHTRYDDNRL